MINYLNIYMNDLLVDEFNSLIMLSICLPLIKRLIIFICKL